MSTRMTLSNVARLVVGAVCLVSTSACGSELLRTGRAPVYLVVDNASGSTGNGGTAAAFLLSDVETIVDDVATYFNDNATVSLRSELKNPSVAATAINDVTMTRYHVSF